MFQDYLFYGTDVEVQYAFRMLHLSDLTRQAQQMHNLTPERAVLLAEALLGGILLSSVLEDEERINVRLQCEENFTIATETTRHAETRGYAEFTESSPVVQSIDRGELPELNIHLRSMRSVPKTQKVFTGHTVTKAASFEEVFNEHLDKSYQMFTTLKIQAWINPADGQLNAFGVIYQELPDLRPEMSEALKKHLENLPSLQELFENNSDPDALAAKLIPHKTHPVKSINPKWSCTCSQESVENMITTLQADEVQDIIEKNEVIEVRCHYCSKTYNVTPERAQTLVLSKALSQQSGQQKVKN